MWISSQSLSGRIPRPLEIPRAHQGTRTQDTVGIAFGMGRA
jgi:hypothetical protein